MCKQLLYHLACLPDLVANRRDLYKVSIEALNFNFKLLRNDFGV